MSLLKDGETIRETYEVERFLGEGAFAEVYRQIGFLIVVIVIVRMDGRHYLPALSLVSNQTTWQGT
jgi:hypothetical protein